MGDVARIKSEMDRLRQETRYMKGVEAKMHWDMQREEISRQTTEKKHAEKDLLKWRQGLAKNMMEDEQEKREAMQLDDLQCSREFQEHRRLCRQTEDEEERARVQEEYYESKENSEWHAEARQMKIQEIRAQDLEASLENRKLVAETRLEDSIAVQMEQQWRRQAQEEAEAEHALMMARRERDLALSSLEHVRVQRTGVRRCS
jgi:hypothetical protein